MTRATGVGFRPVGRTGESFLRAYQRMRYGEVGKKELIVIWVDHEDYQAILRRERDRARRSRSPRRWPGLSGNQDQYFGGIIVVDDDATSSAASGTGTRTARSCSTSWGTSWAWTTKDPDQLMYSGPHPNFGLHDYGDGDLEGLRRLGRDAGCLD